MPPGATTKPSRGAATGGFQLRPDGHVRGASEDME